MVPDEDGKALYLKRGKTVMICCRAGGPAPPWDHVHQRGGYQLSQWHQLYGEKYYHGALALYLVVVMMMVLLVLMLMIVLMDSAGAHVSSWDVVHKP